MTCTSLDPFAIAVTEDHIIWTDDTDGHLHHASIDGSNPDILAYNIGSRGVAVDRSNG